MKGQHLGELEELTLITTAILGESYTVSIVNEVKENTGRNLTLSAVHTVLVRLEKKGFLKSFMGGATNERGGRRRRLYKITSSGYAAMNEAKQLRTQLWDKVPALTFEFSRS